MKRYEHIDIARGIAILLVILGHSCTSLDGINRIILSFHMPLFFFLSGVFSKPCESSFKAVWGGVFLKMKRLLLPEVVLSTICVLQAIMIRLKAGLSIVDYNPWSDVINWFLPVLFICSSIHMTLLTVTKSIRPIYVNLVLLIACFCLIPYCINQCGEYDTISKLSNILYKVPIAYAFFILGNILKPIVLSETFSSQRRGIIDICIASVLVIVANINKPVLMYMNQYGNIWLFLMTSLMGIYVVLRISKKIKDCPFLTYAGTNSIVFYVWNFITVYVTAFVLNKFLPNLITTSAETFTSIRFFLSIGILYIITEFTVNYIPFIYGLKRNKK